MQGDMDLLGFIVQHNEGDQCIRLASKVGVKGGTVFLGEGTARSGLLRKLGLDTIQREIVLLIAPTTIAKQAMDYVVDKKNLEEKNRGISFRLPLKRVIGIAAEGENEPVKGEKKEMYQAIFVIVDEGEAERVLDAANAAGSQGGTVIQAHGSGDKNTKRVFNMEIEPEKDIVLIISPGTLTEKIVDNINKELNLEEPNAGILFTTDLSETRGIV
ncbi:MAG: P-II family nitrogen regulator [Alkalibacterium sp.]